MVQYKLYYFNIKGRGEFLRMLFVVAGQEFQDNRIEGPNWPTLKSQAPLGRMPFLEINDGQKTTKIGQSLTIGRYLARKFNLYGKEEMDFVQADMWADEIADMVNAMGQAMFEKEEERKKMLLEKFGKETMPTHMKLIDARLGANNGHLAGSELTYADLFLFSVLDQMKDFRESVFTQFPNLKKFDENMRTHPKLKAYLEKRPKTAN